MYFFVDKNSNPTEILINHNDKACYVIGTTNIDIANKLKSEYSKIDDIKSIELKKEPVLSYFLFIKEKTEEGIKVSIENIYTRKSAIEKAQFILYELNDLTTNEKDFVVNQSEYKVNENTSYIFIYYRLIDEMYMIVA